MKCFLRKKIKVHFFNNQRIRVSKKRRLKDSLLVTGGPKFDSPKKKLIFEEYINVSNLVDAPIRKFGSAALDLANVACGRFDGYWQSELKYWDIAAGIIILRESGGYIDFLDESEKNPKTHCHKRISRSNIHQELIDAISKKNIE